MQRNTLETVMGAIVLAAAAGFVTLAYEAANIRGNGGYEIIAEFGSTGGLSVGDDVRISGIKVGRMRHSKNCHPAYRHPAKSSHCGKGGWTRLFTFAYTPPRCDGATRAC